MTRTELQNNSLHKWFREISWTLNEAGYSVNDRKVIQMDIPFTEHAVKENMFKKIIEAMFGTDSTAKLSTKELTEAAEVLQRFLADKFEINVAFPSREQQMMESYEND